MRVGSPVVVVEYVFLLPGKTAAQDTGVADMYLSDMRSFDASSWLLPVMAVATSIAGVTYGGARRPLVCFRISTIWLPDIRHAQEWLEPKGKSQ